MRVTVIDALAPGNPLSGPLERWVRHHEQLLAHHVLQEERFAPCVGCFRCWVEFPGTCQARDAANGVMRDMVEAEVVVWVTRPRFGCWDPMAKVAMDKSIGLISPFFTTVEGETHHHPRYQAYPRWVVLAVVDGHTTQADRERFEQLVARNATNLRTGAPDVLFLQDRAPFSVIEEQLLQVMASPRKGGMQHVEPLPAQTHSTGVTPRSDRPRHALVWVGSAKPPGTSSSEALGRALASRLEDRGWTTEVVGVADVVHLREPDAPDLVRAAERADLLILASPVYVDALPSVVLAGLRHLADAHLNAPPAVLPIVQCGFPELTHTRLALEVARRATEEMGSVWAGHLAMGGGGSVNGKDPDQLTGQVQAQRAALDATAAALDAGEPVPASATALFGTPTVAPWVYRWVGNLSWALQGLANGQLTRMGRRPFEMRPRRASPARARSPRR